MFYLILTDGKLILGKSKGWFNSSLIEFPYKHPSTKQCNYSVDTSNFVTKSDLDKVKGMIDVSARVVHSAGFRQSVTINVSNKPYDYAEIVIFSKMAQADGGTSEKNYGYVTVPGTTVTVKVGCTANIPVMCIYNRNEIRLSNSIGTVTATSSSLNISIPVDADHNSYYCSGSVTFYKYDS